MSGYDNGGGGAPTMNQPSVQPPPPATAPVASAPQGQPNRGQSKNIGWIVAIAIMAALVLLGGGVLLGLMLFVPRSGESTGERVVRNSIVTTTASAPSTTAAPQPSTSDASTAPTTAETSIAPKTAAPTTVGTAAVSANVYDWDGARYDYGAIESVQRVGPDVVISFDRYQVWWDGKVSDASTFSSEPIVYGNTDEPSINENPKLRRFVVLPSANLLTLTGLHESGYCSDFESWDPVWTNFSFDQLLSMDTDVVGGHQTSLTFDSAGRVTQIRHSEGC